jgi:hypothetical protein
VPNERVDEEAYAHPSGACHHGFAAADVFNNPKAEYGSCDVDGAQDDGCYVGVVQARSCENGCSVVDEVVRSLTLVLVQTYSTSQSRNRVF